MAFFSTYYYFGFKQQNNNNNNNNNKIKTRSNSHLPFGRQQQRRSKALRRRPLDGQVSSRVERDEKTRKRDEKTEIT
jgi:hypothetical protein